MMKIPNIIAPDVPVGKDDSENVEEQTFGEKKVPTFEIPYHSDIMSLTWKIKKYLLQLTKQLWQVQI